MAVPEQTPYKEYTANGVTKIFPLEFDVLEQDHLIVLVNDLEPSVGSWSLIDNSVVFTLPPADGANIKIRRDTPLERTTDYQSYNNSFRPQPVNNDFDRIWWKLQELGVVDWILSKRLDKEIQDRIIADLALKADYILRDSQLKDDYIQRDNGLKQDYIYRDSQLKKYIDSMIALVTGDPSFDGITADMVTDESGLTQQEINNSQLTVFNFGAKGDGVTDDSDAFQAYIDSVFTPKNVYCGQRKSVFLIKKTVDFKGKGLVGNGFGAQNSADYALSSILVKPDFIGTDVFINVKSTIKNLNMVQETPTDTVNGIQFDPYNTSIDNVNIKGFALQAYAKVACVALRVTNFTSIDAKKFAIQIQDKVTAQSTTAYFRNCSFQWGEGAIDFADNGQVYGSSFENIILEYMRTGITGGLFSKCSFDNIWAEQTIDHVSRPWLQNSIPQQMTDNTLGIIKLQGDWTNPYLPTGLCPADNFGGIVTDNSLLGIQNNTGNGIVLSLNGIKTRHHPYAENRSLVITTQDTAPESGYKTPLEVNIPNGELYFGNYSPLDYAPVKFKRVVSKTKDSTTPHYCADELSPLGWIAEAYNPSTGTSGRFHAPMFLTWDSGRDAPVNAGWTITRVSEGVFNLTRQAGNTLECANPNLIVSGVFSSEFLVNRNSPIESYEGSWSDYRVGAGFNIYFSNISGVAKDPSRFTIAFTLVV